MADSLCRAELGVVFQTGKALRRAACRVLSTLPTR